jgi:exodeoxyribonuclease VII small subunit
MAQRDKPEKTFEEQLQRLQEIVASLEQDDLPLERGVELFREGCELAKSCREQLKEAQHKVQIYAKGVLQDFDPEEHGGYGQQSDEDEA